MTELLKKDHNYVYFDLFENFNCISTHGVYMVPET